MQSVITRDPDILGGIPVFEGTRVPVKNLFDCLERGYDVREFLEDFPAVSETQVSQLLREIVPAQASSSGNLTRKRV